MSEVIQYNPATGDVLGTVPEASPDQIRTAMTRARAAFPIWRATPLQERLAFMRKLRLLLVEQAHGIAEEIAAATGKIRGEALSAEVLVVADAIHYYEQHAETFLARQRVATPILFFGNRSYIQYQPLGVVGVISPWNFPFQLAMIPVISALIAGNAVLLKPSEVTPFVGTLMERLFQESGFPEGVVQVLHGGRDVGAGLTAARPDKIFFTGSVATGKKIMAAAAEHLIPVDLELGGKDPMIVLADADLDRAVNGALWGAFTNAGQVCMSVERVYVQRPIYDEFVRRVTAGTRSLRLGEDVGSMTFPPQLALVEEHLRDAVEKGARIECGGTAAKAGTLYFHPTVLTCVDHSMKIMRDETFGPVLPILPFDTVEEAVALANDSEFGLNASVWTSDLAKAESIAAQLVSGNVCINEVISTVANPHLPFGGVKQSGIGSYHGPGGLHTFSHRTSVMLNKGKKKREVNWFPYTAEQERAFHTIIRLLFGTSRRATLADIRNLIGQVLGKDSKDSRPAGQAGPNGKEHTS